MNARVHKVGSRLRIDEASLFIAATRSFSVEQFASELDISSRYLRRYLRANPDMLRRCVAAAKAVLWEEMQCVLCNWQDADAAELNLRLARLRSASKLWILKYASGFRERNPGVKLDGVTL
jgi:hypothetical protein